MDDYRKYANRMDLIIEETEDAAAYAMESGDYNEDTMFEVAEGTVSAFLTLSDKKLSAAEMAIAAMIIRNQIFEIAFTVASQKGIDMLEDEITGND